MLDARASVAGERGSSGEHAVRFRGTGRRRDDLLERREGRAETASAKRICRLPQAFGLRRRIDDQRVTPGGLPQTRDGFVELASRREREAIGVARERK